jgi:hypothetical protein
MAGSLVWRGYTASVPTGAIFSAQVDESNARATYNSSELMPAAVPLGYQRPKTLRMRAVRAVLRSNINVRRIFYVADPTLYQQIASDPAATIRAAHGVEDDDSVPPNQVVWDVTSAPEERYTRRPRATDSGIIDGTPAN